MSKDNTNGGATAYPLLGLALQFGLAEQRFCRGLWYTTAMTPALACYESKYLLAGDASQRRKKRAASGYRIGYPSRRRFKKPPTGSPGLSAGSSQVTRCFYSTYCSRVQYRTSQGRQIYRRHQGMEL